MRKNKLLAVLSLVFIVHWSNAQITWQNFKGPFGGAIFDLEFSSNGNRYYALVSEYQGPYYLGELFVTTDNGANWQKLEITPDKQYATDVEVDGTDLYVVTYAGLYKSTNGGQNFSLLNTQDIDILRFKRNPVTGTFVGVGHDEVWRSEDNGATWTLGYESPSPGAGSFQDVEIDAAGRIFISGGVGLVRSSDDGFSAVSVTSGLSDIQIWDIEMSSDGTTLFAHHRNGVQQSSSSPIGSSWSSPTGLEDASFSSFAGRMGASSDGNIIFVDNQNNKVYSKTTGAASWTKRSNLAADFLCVAARNGNSFFVGSEQGLFRTSNGGTNFTAGSNGIDKLRHTDIIVTPDNKVVVAGDGKIFTSSNLFTSSPSWNEFYFDEFRDARQLFLMSDESVLALGPGTGMRSNTNVDGWPSTYTTPNNTYVFARRDETTFYGVSQTGRLYYSSNSGSTWNTAADVAISGLPVGGYVVERLETSGTNNRLLLKVRNGGNGKYELYRITYSPTGSAPTSASAALVSGGGFTLTEVDDVKRLGNTVYALGPGVGSHRLAISTDGGSNWTVKTVPSGSRLSIASNGYIFVIRDGSFSLSRDGGNTFNLYEHTSENAFETIGLSMIEDGRVFLQQIFGGGLVFSDQSLIPPVDPSNLLVAGKSSDEILLRWNDNSDTEEYYVIEKEGVSGYDSIGINYGVYASGGYAYLRVTGLQPNTSYNFRVRARNDAGYSNYVTLTNIITTDECVSTIPDNRSWAATLLEGGGTPIANLQIVSQGNGRYYVSDLTLGAADAAPNISNPAGGYFYESCGETYMYQADGGDIVANTNGIWNGSNSITIKWITDGSYSGNPVSYNEIAKTLQLTLNASDPKPDAPTNVVASIYDNTKMEVRWTKSAFETEYVIERSTTSGSGFVQIATVPYPQSTYLDNSVAVNTTYFYRVRARNTNCQTNPDCTSAPSSESSGVQFKQPNFILTDNAVTSGNGNTGAVLWADFDNDGDEDLLIVPFNLFSATPVSPYLFRNDGGNVFTPVNGGFDQAAYVSAAAADYNNDGEVDLYFSVFNSENLLYRGGAGMTFTKVNSSIITTVPASIEEVSFAPIWIDFDNNGRLDFFLYFQDVPSLLFSQNSDGTFTQQTTASPASTTFYGSDASWVDFDNDGDLDAFFVDGPDYNNSQENASKLFRNNGDGTFTFVSTAIFDTSGSDYEPFSASWGDYNNDGRQDLFISNESEQATARNRLYLNNGDGTFTKMTTSLVMELQTSPTFGGTWGDINNDGRLDLLVVKTGANIIYLNQGSGVFTKVVNEKFNDPYYYNFGIALADYDKDGFLDAVLGTIDPSLFEEFGQSQGPQPGHLLFRNNNTSGNWLQIKLIGAESNRSAIGARIRVRVTGLTFQYRQVLNHTAFFGQNSSIAHFGLGTEPDVDFVEITWPSGHVQVLFNVDANQIITIEEDNDGPAITSRTPVANATDVLINTTISVTLDEAAIARAGKLMTLTGQGDATPTATIDVSLATKSSNTYTFTLSNALTTNKTYNVSFEAGAFLDAYENESPAANWSFTTYSGPQLTATVPANNATTVNASTQLQLTFNVPTTGVAGKFISVFTGTSTTASLTLDAGNAVVTGNTQSLSFPFAINNEVTYRIVVEAGAFIDANGAPSAAIADGQWSFTTVAGPKVTVLTPADELQTVNANTTLALEFDKAVTPEADKSLRVYQAGITDPIYTILLSTGTASSANRKYTYTLPQKLPNQANFSVIVDVRSFADANGNLFIGVGSGQWDFRTTQGPNITTYAPLAGATNVAINASITLTFDKNIMAVAGKKIRVYDGPSSLLVDVDVSTTGTVTTNRYTLPAPAEGWPYQTQLAVQLDEGAFTDTNLNDAFGIADVQYTFTTVEAPDTQAPAITFTPPASFDKGFGTQTISVEVTDNKGVTGAKFFFRPISGTDFTEANGEAKANNRWEFSVPETAFDANGLQYYFTAVDAAGNTARQPATGFNTATLRYTQPIEVTTALGFGGEKNNWKIFAMPFVTTTSITTLFDELASPKKEKVDYRIITYASPTTSSPNGSWLDYPSSFTTFTRGVGYFVNIKEAVAVTLSTGLTVPNNNRDNLFQLNLKQGWNQVGNPYLTQISWSDVAAFNNLSGQLAELKTYNGSAYVNTTNLAAFTGGFVFAPAATTISIPFLGQTSGGRLKETSFADGEWLLPITLTQGDARNEDAGIGMHREAEASFDDLDRVNAPRFIDFAEINFAHPEHFARHFVRDVVPMQPEHEWAFTVESNQQGLATLQWDASALDAELYLYDESMQKPVNMREVNTYTFDPQQSGRFKIFYGDNALQRISPHRVTLGNAFPNPSSGKTHIPFTLPERNGLFQVQMEVFDMMGRKVATVLNKELPTGFYQADWQPGEIPTDGLYTYRLSVSAGNNSEVLSGKVLMKK